MSSASTHISFSTNHLQYRFQEDPEVFQDYIARITLAVNIRVFQRSADGQLETNAYLDRFTIPDERANQEDLLYFFVGVMHTLGVEPLGGENTIKSAIVSSGVLDDARL